MKWLLAFAFFGVVASAPQFNGTPGASGFKDTKTSVPSIAPSLAALFPPFQHPAPPPQPPPQYPPPAAPPAGPPATGGGLFMDIPNTGPRGAYGAPMMSSYQYCPPGPTGNDACKDQKLQEALYHPDGTPRYNWVPPKNPWDNSLPDTVKDTALHILIMKVSSRPGRMPTPKEWELYSLLGDPKDYIANNPFAPGGGHAMG